MTLLRYLLLAIAALLSLALLLLVIPASHAFILSKTTTYFLKLPVTFKPPTITWEHYAIKGRLGETAVLTLDADYTTTSAMSLDASFDGDLALFSKAATTTLPHIALSLAVQMTKEKLTAKAKLLDGSIDAHLDLDTLSYEAVATDLSLLSFWHQQDLEPYVDGIVMLDSKGSLSEVMDIDLELRTQGMRLLAPALRHIDSKKLMPEPAELNSSIRMKDDTLLTSLAVTSSLATVDVDAFKYDLDSGEFESSITLTDHIQAHRPLERLEAKTKGRYFEERLHADLTLDAGDYLLRLQGIDYIDDLLTGEFSLYASIKEIVDIAPPHQITGTFEHTPQSSEVTLTSALLDDTLSIVYQDDHLKVDADALSLEGLLSHLRQKPIASAKLTVRADIVLPDPLHWQASVDTTDLLLSKEISKVLGHDDKIALRIDASAPDASHIHIRPKIASSMLRLDKGEIVYDLNRSIVQVDVSFKDVNISRYFTPSLVLDSQVELKEPLRVKADLTSPYETIRLRLSKIDKLLQGDAYLDLKNIDRMPGLEAFQAIKGSIDFTSQDEQHHFIAHLKDINSTYYDTPFADINASFRQREKLVGKLDVLTPYEMIGLDLSRDANITDATFSYDVTRLDRFGALAPDHKTEGSGQLALDGSNVKVDIISREFGRLEFSQEDEVMTLGAEALPLSELFALRGKEAFIDGTLTVCAKKTSEEITASIRSEEIRPTDSNASIRPTALLAKLDLEGNTTRLSGALDVRTDHEHLRFDALSLSPKMQTLNSDLLLESDDLTQGTPILPKALIGTTRITGDIRYDQHLKLHLEDKRLTLDERTHQKIDANATGTLDIAFDADLSLDAHQAEIDIEAKSPYFTLHPFETSIDLDASHLQTRLHLATDLWQKESDMVFDVHYTDPLRIDGDIKTAYETLSIDHLYIDNTTQRADGDYQLRLKQTPDDAFLKHGDALFFGSLSSDPVQQATLQSDSFGGDLNVKATQQEITIESQRLLLERVMDFLAMDSALKSGYLDMDAKVLSDDFLELDTNTMRGDISLDATDLLLEGIDADKSIDVLKDFQDISIFEGNFPGKSIVSSIVTAPVDLVKHKKPEQSVIQQVHADSYIAEGRLYCYDCAVKTAQNRIALKGAIDLNTTAFEHFQVGLLKKDGCAFFTQDIKGSLEEPKIELSKASLALITGTIRSVGNVVGSGVKAGTKIISGTGDLAGDIIDNTAGLVPIVNKATGVVSESIRGVADKPEEIDTMLTRRCRPFYQGVVRHPE